MYHESAGVSTAEHLSGELRLPYDLSSEELHALPNAAQVGVGLISDRMKEKYFANSNDLYTATAEATALDEDSIKAAFKELTRYSKDQIRYAELVRGEEGISLQLTADGQDWLRDQVGKVRFGTS
jgi:hypothetical protein